MENDYLQDLIDLKKETIYDIKLLENDNIYIHRMLYKLNELLKTNVNKHYNLVNSKKLYQKSKKQLKLFIILGLIIEMVLSLSYVLVDPLLIKNILGILTVIQAYTSIFLVTKKFIDCTKLKTFINSVDEDSLQNNIKELNDKISKHEKDHLDNCNKLKSLYQHNNSLNKKIDESINKTYNNNNITYKHKAIIRKRVED